MRLHGLRDPIKPQYGTTGGAACRSGSDNEVWSYTDEVFEICKKYLFLREKLKPYIAEQMKAASLKGTPVMRPLFYDFPADRGSWETEDEFMFGPNYLVAPILHEGERERELYLPSGAKWTNAWTGEKYEGGGTIKTAAPLDLIPVFTRDGSVFQP
jgi:alpha-D-xyloside xylohydrolase